MIEMLTNSGRCESHSARCGIFMKCCNHNGLRLRPAQICVKRAGPSGVTSTSLAPDHSDRARIIMAAKALPSIAELRQRLKCNPSTGEIWRRTLSGWVPSFTATDSDGYKIGQSMGRMLKAHRVIWALHYGEWPASEIDHEDGDRSNNRIGNLRLATRSGQLQNVGIRATNRSGYPGVSWHRGKGRWRAQIMADGRKLHLGYYDCPATAGSAYVEAKANLHTFHPTMRKGATT